MLVFIYDLSHFYNNSALLQSNLLYVYTYLQPLKMILILIKPKDREDWLEMFTTNREWHET